MSETATPKGESVALRRYDWDYPQRRLGVDVTNCGQCSWSTHGDHVEAWHDHQKSEHAERYALLMAIVDAFGSIGGSWDLRYEGAAMRLAGTLLSVTDDMGTSGRSEP